MPAQVLIIDTDIQFMLRLKKALEARNYVVRTVGRPQMAPDALADAEFDIAVIDLMMEDPSSLIQTLNERAPHLPIILSGQSEGDIQKVQNYQARSFLLKPYRARDLIEIIEHVLHAAPDESAASAPPAVEAAPTFGFQQPSTSLLDYEPPPDEEATIGDVFDGLDIEIEEFETGILTSTKTGSETVQHPLPPDTLPETIVEPLPSPIIPEPPIAADDSPAVSALRISNDNHAVDDLLTRIDSWVQQTGRPPVHPLPSWLDTPFHTTKPVEAPDTTGPDIEAPPYIAVTQPVSLPDLDFFPDSETTGHQPTVNEQELNAELLDALADADDADDPRLQSVLQEVAAEPIIPPEEEDLVAMPVEEITRAMGVIDLDEDVPDDSRDTEAVNELLDEIEIVAHAALQLTQFSLESTALGTLLTYGEHLVARTGDFSDTSWHEIAQDIAEVWQREGNLHTRLLYRNITGTGEALFFSTRTVDDLTLTMIFSADTPLRIIRQQARQLGEALALVPEKVQEAQAVSPPEPASPESPAAQTLPARPTDLRPPEEMVAVIEAEKPLEREPGTYIGYGCLWLAQNPDKGLADDLIAAIERWLRRAAQENNWDVIAVNIGPTWVNLHIEIPAQATPGDVVATLMQETQIRLYDAVGIDTESSPPVWADSYNLTMPGRLLEPDEIEAFIQYHIETTIR